MPAPLLVFAIGNELRGDDALAPLLLRQLAAQDFPQTEFVEDFQLQIEHVTDLDGRDAILFVDADMSCAAPCLLQPIIAAHDHSYTSHAMTPQSLLHAFQQFYGKAAPPSYQLRIRGYGFELGENLSPEAESNLQQAVVMAQEWIAGIEVVQT